MRKLFLEGGGFPAFWYIFGFGNELMRNTFMYSNKESINKIGGYSAGAIAATLICCHDYTNKKMIDKERVIDVCKVCISKYKIGKLEEIVRKMMHELLPMNAHKMANGKLVLMLCDPSNKYRARMVRQWDNRTNLIDCVVASTFIPLLSKFQYKDSVYGCIDGGFCMNRTETIKEEFDIICSYSSSSSYVENIIPIEEKDVEKNYMKGQLDALFV